MPKIGIDENAFINEMKGEVEITVVQFPKELGEEHPFEFEKAEKAYIDVGLVKAAVDKHVDFIISPGFYVTSKNKKAETLIRKFIEDTNFGLLLREYIREGLVKGNAFFEIAESDGEIQIKLLNANRMFLKRKKTGEVEYYRQYTGNASKFTATKVIDFKPKEIAHWAFDKIGDGAYGYGMVYSAANTLNYLSRSEKDVHMLVKQKAGSPYHWKLGTEKEPVTQSDVDNFTQRLTYLNNKQNWVTDHKAEAKILDFGNISDKFTGILEHDTEMLFHVFQVPAILMGKANIPEGIAKVQLDAFERRIQSIQASIEKVIEEKVFRRILRINGLDAQVELEWGMPSEDSINERILKLTTLLQNPLISPNLRRILEIDLGNNLGYEEQVQKFFLQPEDPEDLERKKEEELSQPEIPGEKDAAESQNVYLHEFHLPKEELQKDYSLNEYLGFNYLDFKKAVLEAIKSDTFDDLRATNAYERGLGKLNNRQITELRNIMYEGFDKGKSIQTIAKDLERLKLKNRYTVNSEGKKILQVVAEERPIMIARTESTRVAGIGAMNSYEDKGIQEKKWVAAVSDRTCERCIGLDGQVVKINESFKALDGTEALTPPLHIFCRCGLAPVTELA